jgi:hypothetical protein
VNDQRASGAGVTRGEPPSRTESKQSARRVMAANGMWLVAALGLLVWLGFEAATLGPAACELAHGSSFYGDASWSWPQLGQVCTWELPEAAVEWQRGPGLNRWIFVAILTAWFASLRLLSAGRR